MMQSQKRDGLHHVAYEMRDFMHLKEMLDHLATLGHRMAWGPGRHGVGHNIFTYHADPDGNFIELFTELDVIADEETGDLRAAALARGMAAGAEILDAGTGRREQVGLGQPRLPRALGGRRCARW